MKETGGPSPPAISTRDLRASPAASGRAAKPDVPLSVWQSGRRRPHGRASLAGGAAARIAPSSNKARDFSHASFGTRYAARPGIP